MFWLKPYTDKIRAHLNTGDAVSLTYAALESRLALERVCYERLRISHKYISADDLRTWKPQYVVQTVMEMVDPKIATEWQLQMGSEPGDNPPNYVSLGTQKGFDPKYINQLWQAMSSFLHCDVPRSSDHTIGHYRTADKMKPKIEEVLRELDRISEGSIMGAMVFEHVSFECGCGQTNRRATVTLQHDAIVNCIREGCREQYRVEKTGDEFQFERRMQKVTCHNCGAAQRLPHREIHELKKDERAWFHCSECKEENTFMWRLMQVKRRDNDKSDLDRP
jgi:hypothetical protein